VDVFPARYLVAAIKPDNRFILAQPTKSVAFSPHRVLPKSIEAANRVLGFPRADCTLVGHR
jgi:hypothetical protein